MYVLTISRSSSGVAGVLSMRSEATEDVSESIDSSSYPKKVSTTMCLCWGEKVERSNRFKKTFPLTGTVSLNAPFKGTSLNSSVREKINSSFCIKSFKNMRLRIQFSHQTNAGKPFPPLLALNFFYVFSSSAIFPGPGGSRNKTSTLC